MMLKGIFYTAISKYSSVIISIVISAILARLLTPEEFGIVALVSVFTVFFGLLGEMGIGPAIIQKKELTEDDLVSIFNFSILMALFLAVIFFLSSGLIANFYNEPELIPVVKLLSISIFFNILLIVPSALNRKELHFKQMAFITVGIQLSAGVLAIWMALENFSYYSLVYQSILSSFLGFAIFYKLYPIKLALKLKKRPLQKIASFSSYQFAFNFINYFSRNLDNILIGKYIGNSALGFYQKSYTLMLLPVRNLTHVITPVLHPVLSNHQEDKIFIYYSYKNILKILAILGFPLSVFLFFSAPELILLLFGPQWEKSIPVFEILALSVGIQICLSSSGAIFQAVNRTDLLLVSGILGSVLFVAGISYGVFFGRNLESVGEGLVIAFVLNFLLGFFILINKALNESFLSFLKIFIFPLIISTTVAVGMFLIQRLEIGNNLWALFLKAFILGIILLLVFLSSREKRNFILKILKKNKK